MIKIFFFFFAATMAIHLVQREDLGDLYQSKGPQFKIGVEVGVHAGTYSKEILKRWKNCEAYYLVDIWEQMKNYKDGCNVGNSEQEKIFAKAKSNVEFAKGKTKIVRKLSTDAAKYFQQNNIKFDSIYIDARHDYCGVKEDIDAYYHLLKVGGILSGHDYNAMPPPGTDWNICANGSYVPGSVKRAVDEFVNLHNLKLELVQTSWYLTKTSE